jgi:AraC-like DNA-binding protein
MALHFHPVVLIRAALTMAGPTELSAQRLAVFGQPKKLLYTDPIAGPLMQSLDSLMHSLDQLSTATASTAEMLRLDDILIRMAVLLLLPELMEAESCESSPAFTAVAARRRLQPLLDWIDANLNQAIALTDLEARGQMSRRNLQYTFRRAYDCTPMQWLRRRRLDLAMQRLQQRDRSVAVTAISRELGFINSAAFSREFRRQFGCSPSSVRRLRT